MAETTYNVVRPFFMDCGLLYHPCSDGLNGRPSHTLHLIYTTTNSPQNAQVQTQMDFQFVTVQMAFMSPRIRPHQCDSISLVGVYSAAEGPCWNSSIGSAIYVYGNVDEGMQYTWSLNYAKKTTGIPNGSLLIAAENLKLERSRTHFTLDITITQFAAGARFQFNKADVVVGTGMIG